MPKPTPNEQCWDELTVFGTTVILPSALSLGMLCRRSRRRPSLTLEGAVLGLSALMIAFTFAMVLSRFDSQPILKGGHNVALG